MYVTNQAARPTVINQTVQNQQNTQHTANAGNFNASGLNSSQNANSLNSILSLIINLLSQLLNQGQNGGANTGNTTGGTDTGNTTGGTDTGNTTGGTDTGNTTGGTDTGNTTGGTDTGNQTNANGISTAPGQITLNGTATYDTTFLQEKYVEFRNSDSFPKLASADLRNTNWGYSGSGSVLGAFYNYLGQNYPQGGNSGTSPAFGNQTPVDVNSANGQTTLSGPNGSGSYDDATLQGLFNGFRSSESYPTAQSRDLVTTPWGYEGSSSALTAFYNSLLFQSQPQDTTPETDPGFGDQTKVNVTSNGPGQITLNGTATYDTTFLQEKFAEFKRSDHSPSGQTLDLRDTNWGFRGSSSTLRAFYNYLGQNYPQGGNSGTSPAFGNQTAVDASSANGQTTLSGPNGSGSYSDADLQGLFNEFRNSESYPAAQTADLVTTPWGYEGSSSALTAFYNSLLFQRTDPGPAPTPESTPTPGHNCYSD